METMIEQGQVLGGAFEVGELLSSGTYGTVHLGKRLDDGSEIVIKALRGDADTADPAASDRFVREATVASRLRHPNIVRIHNVGRTRSGVLYMILERLRGNPLAAAMFRRTLAPHVATIVLRQILSGLDYAHQHSVVHRDLKPSNVFVCEPDYLAATGQPRSAGVKLIDFGFVKVLDPRDTAMQKALTVRGHIVGSPGYLAPESLRGAEVTPQVDLYAAGIIAYEMLTGTQAFPGSTMDRLVAQVTTTPPEPGPEITSDPAWPVVHKLMQADPSRRYASAADAIRDLDAF